MTPGDYFILLIAASAPLAMGIGYLWGREDGRAQGRRDERNDRGREEIMSLFHRDPGG